LVAGVEADDDAPLFATMLGVPVPVTLPVPVMVEAAAPHGRPFLVP